MGRVGGEFSWPDGRVVICRGELIDMNIILS